MFKVDSVVATSADGSAPELADSSLLLLADILPTGAFAALQALQHAKASPMLTARPYPFSDFVPGVENSVEAASAPLLDEDRTLTFAIVGLGPVGVVSEVLGYFRAGSRISRVVRPAVRCRKPF